MDFARTSPRQSAIALLTVLLVTTSCAKEIDVQPTPAAPTQALYDPSAAILPAPTDLVKNSTTGLLAVPVADEKNDPAQAEFDRYLNSLDGFPQSSTVTFCLSTEPDAASLTAQGAITVVKLPKQNGNAPEAVAISVATPKETTACPVLTKTACNVQDKTGCAAEQVCVVTSAVTAFCADAGWQIAITRENGAAWERGTSYGFFVSNGVKDKAGKAIAKSVTFELTTGPRALCAWNDTERKCTYNYSTLLETQVRASFVPNPADLAAGPEWDRQFEEAVLASATQLEALRQVNRQLLDVAKAGGLDQKNIVLAWSFSTVSLTEAIFDPATGKLPGPGNDIILDSKTGLVSIPESPGESPEEKALRLGLNTLDGFSTTATYFALMSGKLDPSSIKAGDHLLIINTADPTDVVGVEFGYSDEANALTMRPSKPLEEGTQYAVVVISKGNATPTTPEEALASTGGLADPAGRRVVASSAFALVRMKNALAEDGKSTVSVLDDQSAVQLEQIRSQYNVLLTTAELLLPGFDRNDVAVLWTFTTQSFTSDLTKLRALPYTLLAASDNNAPKWAAAPGQSAPGLDPTKANWPAGLANDNVGALGSATFTSWLKLDVANGPFLPGDSDGKATQVPVFITTPKMAACRLDGTQNCAAGETCATLVDPAGSTPIHAGTCTPPTDTSGCCDPGNGLFACISYCVPQKWPVAVFQHGIGRTKNDVFAIANSLAGAGFVSIAFDTPWHGDRTGCRDDNDCINTASCSADRICCDKTTTSDCQTAYFVDQDKDGTPDANAALFLNTDNPFGIRDSIRQYVIDASALLRSLTLGASSSLQWPLVNLVAAGGPTPVPVPSFDSDNTQLIGQSLGAMLSVLVLATDSTPKRGLLNVPGAPIVEIYKRSVTPDFAKITDGLLDSRGLCRDQGGKKVCPRDSAGALQLFHTLQWIADPADPANFAQYVKASALKDVVASQVAGSDVMVTKKELHQQIAGRDEVIVTPLQEQLNDWLGVTFTKYPNVGHGFLLQPTPQTEAASTVAAQKQAVQFLATGTVCTPNTTTGDCN
jgi:hypothetical protein